MNPEDLIKLLHGMPGFGRDATQVASPLPQTTPATPVDPTRLANAVANTQPQRTIGPATPGNHPLGLLDYAQFLTKPLHDAVNFAGGGVLDNLRTIGAQMRGEVPEPPHTGLLDANNQITPDARAAVSRNLAALTPGGAAEQKAAALGEDAVHMFEHYSPKAITELDPKFMGSAFAGAERSRPGRPAMSHVYVAGAKPEPMFRGSDMYKYSVPVKGRIYDIATDPDGIVAKLRKNGLDPDKMERAIGKAGYVGYHSSAYNPETVKLFGTHPVTPSLLPQGDYGILTAENPGGNAASASANKTYLSALKNDLKRMGYKFTSAKGFYPDEKTGEHLHENSLVVPGLKPADAVKLGKKYGQNSVISAQGMHDLTTGTTQPFQGARYVNDGDYYTQFPNGQRVAMDFGHAPAGAVADSVLTHALPDAMRFKLQYGPNAQAALDAEKLRGDPSLYTAGGPKAFRTPETMALPDSAAAHTIIGYHGTTHKFKDFRIGKPGYNYSPIEGNVPVKRAAAFFAEDPKLAQVYAEANAGPKGREYIRKAALTLKNPADLTNGVPENVLNAMREYKANPEMPWLAEQAKQIPPESLWNLFDNHHGMPTGQPFVKLLQELGYDGAKLSEKQQAPPGVDPTSLAVFSDEQIKMLNSLLGLGGGAALAHIKNLLHPAGNSSKEGR